jgi:hypothetical protein
MRLQAAVWLTSTAVAMQHLRNPGSLQHESSNSAHLQRAGGHCVAALSRMAGALRVRWAGWTARATNFGPLLLPEPAPSSTPVTTQVKHLQQLHSYQKFYDCSSKTRTSSHLSCCLLSSGGVKQQVCLVSSSRGRWRAICWLLQMKKSRVEDHGMIIMIISV